MIDKCIVFYPSGVVHVIAEGHHQGGREGEQDLDQGLRTEEDLAEILTEEGQYQFDSISICIFNLVPRTSLMTELDS